MRQFFLIWIQSFFIKKLLHIWSFKSLPRKVKPLFFINLEQETKVLGQNWVTINLS